MSVTLTSLSWSTPDGTPLFTDLDLVFGPGRTGIVGRNGTGKSTLLRLIAGDLRPAAGAIRVSGRVAMLRQAFAPGESLADLFGARAGLALLDRAGAGQASAAELAAADWTLPARIAGALAGVGLDLSPALPLAALSGGQAMRAALAAAVFDAPDVLLLDEPTNNLDADGRRLVAGLLARWPGTLLLASHDRTLLEGVDEIVELSPLGPARYGGGYSLYRDRKAAERAAAAQAFDTAARAGRETARRVQQMAERKARRDGAGKRSRAKGGQPKILLDRARERAEASKGAGARLGTRLAEAAAAATDAARARIEVLQPLRMDLPSTGLPRDRVVLRLDGVTGGHDPARPVIRDLSLQVTGPERIAVTGPNGCGKSTLLALITGALTPLAGQVCRAVPWALLDQSVSLLHPGETLHQAFLRLNPGATGEQGRATLARFRFRAGDGVRRVADLSGGERLRAGLACALGGPQPPALLLLDEPTNHLDLDAMVALETALEGYDGALLVVSHDARFLGALAPERRLVLGQAGAR